MIANTLKNVSKVGFIGLGNMGRLMAKNLLEKNKKLSVFDVVPETLTDIKSEGIVLCQSPAEVASQTSCIITMLPNNSAVQNVYLGTQGIFQSIKPNSVLIDCSTIDPHLPKELFIEAEKRKSLFFDAPVSGGVVGARDATLTFMVGGPQQYQGFLDDLLLCMGSRTIFCGPTGSGQIAKICNNMLLAIHMVGTSEAMNLGIRLGLDPKLLMNVFNTSTGRCWSSEIYNPVPGTISNIPSANNYEGGFGTHLIAKDLGLAQDAATKTETPIPLGSLAHQIYRTLVAQGYALKDFSVIYQFLRNKTSKQ